MEEYGEVTTLRRTDRLIESSGMDFSMLNFMFFPVLIALVLASIGAIFS